MLDTYKRRSNKKCQGYYWNKENKKREKCLDKKKQMFHKIEDKRR